MYQQIDTSFNKCKLHNNHKTFYVSALVWTPRRDWNSACVQTDNFILQTWNSLQSYRNGFWHWCRTGKLWSPIGCRCVWAALWKWSVTRYLKLKSFCSTYIETNLISFNLEMLNFQCFKSFWERLGEATGPMLPMAGFWRPISTGLPCAFVEYCNAFYTKLHRFQYEWKFLLTLRCRVRGGRVVRCRTCDVRSWPFESRQWLLSTNGNSACHPSGVG